MAWGWCPNIEYVHSAEKARYTTLDDQKYDVQLSNMKQWVTAHSSQMSWRRSVTSPKLITSDLSDEQSRYLFYCILLMALSNFFCIDALFRNQSYSHLQYYFLWPACAWYTWAGICQLPALLSLIRLYSADVNLCNVDGMTPLMLAASSDDCILVNVSWVAFAFISVIEVPNMCCVTWKQNAIFNDCHKNFRAIFSAYWKALNYILVKI